MSIANELSSEVAAAVMAQKKDESARSPDDLAVMVRDVFSTLRELDAAEALRRKSRLRQSGQGAEARTATGMSE
jgi:uncharacterized Zn finger protein (UPF0148 family)